MKLRCAFLQICTWGFKGTVDAIIRMPHELILRRNLSRNAKIHSGTRPETGITVVAPLGGSFSLSKTMRDFVVRLKKTGIPHQVFDTSRRDAKVDSTDYRSLLTPPGDFNIMKYDHIVEMLASPMPRNLPLKRCRIAFWESESGILDVFPYLADSNVVVAMSDFNARYFRKVLPSDVNVCKVLYPLMSPPPNLPGRRETRRRFGLDEGDFAVLYNFDLLAFWRKNPDGLLKAFASAFGDSPDAKLVMKTNHADAYPDRLRALARLAESLGVGGRVVFINEYMASSEIYALVNACDAYASLHRGEGFGIGIAEAMQMGKPVVATNWSANTEFCRPDTALLVPYTFAEGKGDPLSERFGKCADADIDAAAAALKTIYMNREMAAEMGLRARKFVECHFSDEAFKKSIENFLKGNNA